MKFVHIADVHLGATPDAGCRWEKDSKQEVTDRFLELIEYLELNPVDMLFVTGDLFDHVPDEKDLMWVDKEFARLKKTDIIYVTGQSDYLKRDCALWKYRFLSRTYVLNGEPFHNSVPVEEKPDRTSYADGVVDCVHFPKYNLDIYGVCQYSRKNERNDLDGAYPHDLSRVSILLAYGGGVNASPFAPEDFCDTKFAYVGLGFRHNYQVYEKGHLYYAGSLTPMEKEETGEHGYIFGYVDKSLTSVKFVPLKGRKYERISVPVAVGETRDEVQDKIIAICRENKNYIYTVCLDREQGANTNYNFDTLRKKYRILEIQGEKAACIDPEELRQCNEDNVLGKHIAFLQASEEDYAGQATRRYVDAMIERLSRESLVVKPEPFHPVVVEVVDKGVRDSMLRELQEIQEELDACDKKKKELEQSLQEYPDQTGNFNFLHEKKRQAEFELEQLKFKNKYVDRIYRRKRLGTILWIDTPIAIVLAIITTFGLIDVAFMNLWDKWVRLVVSLLFYEVLLTVLGFVLYNGSQGLRKRWFGTETPAESHSRLANEIEVLERKVDVLETEETERKIHQERHVQLKQEKKELFQRRVRLAEDSEQLLLILSFRK